MAAAPATDKVIEKHLQEFGFLWGQGQNALRSPEYKLPDLKLLASRIEAHFDGLRLAAQAAPDFLVAKLKGDDAWGVFAAAFALLQLQMPEAASAVVQALLKAEPEQIEPLRQALLHGPIDPVEKQLREVALSAPPHVAVAALEALLYHGRQVVERQRLAEFVRHEDPAVRSAAWRIVALGDATNYP
ncbi:MAG: hypothetical protein ABSG53_24250 [Thermoguttaceae bacterium]|jgi:uncharacterized protein (TIGR02270 family)